MASSLESLHAKLQSKAPVAKTDVTDARAEFRGMDDTAKATQRKLLIDLRYRVKADKVADDAKADLAALQAELPERDMQEAAEHGVKSAGDLAKDVGSNALDVGTEMFESTVGGVSDIARAVREGDVAKAVTHPLAATVLGALGFTLLSNKILGTRSAFPATLFKFTGVMFLAKLIQKYSK